MKYFSFFTFRFSPRKGFTLIELLLVLAIIGVLTSFLVANLISAKERARDAQRKSDLQQIRAALELYRADQNSYPASPLVPACGASLSGGSGATYMQKVPCDPLSKTQYLYTLTGVGTGYTLVACLENGNDAQIDTKNSLPNNPACTGGTHSYTLNNP